MASRLGIGAGIGIPFRNIASGGGKPYLSPEVKEALKAVVIAYGKTNNDSDRAVVKNLVDASNPFIISNAAYKLNSGYGKYEVDFTTWSKRNVLTSNNDNSFSFESKVSSSLLYYSTTIGVDTPSFKIKANISNCLVYYYYINDKGTLSSISILESGEFELPISHNTLYNGNIGIGFEIGRINGTGTGTITQIPSYQGAFVTDGINDLITSTKTVQEMLGGSNEFTVVSMMANLDSVQMMCNSNYSNTNEYNPRNTLEPNGVISMLGYTDKNGTTNNLNLIMGDKDSIKLVDKVNFNSNYVFYPAQYYGSYYKAAWYWTVIANKVLTTDEINQVIAYFNLDRTLRPDILCNITKQGITNDNHADFNDKLIDYSGNGRDIQMNNLAWKGDSGIGKYETDFLDSSIWKYKTNSSVTSDKIVCNKAATHIMLLYYSITDENKYDVPSFNVLKQGNASEYYYIDEQGTRRTFKLLDGINTLPASHGTLFTGTEATCGFGNPGIGNSVTITQIPSHAGGLCLDGVNDFGKVTGMPIYKDYTIIADYERFYLEPITGGRASILSKSSKVGDGSFIFNLEDQDGGKACYTFGGANGNISDDITRIIRYQSKYYNTKTLSIGTAEDNDFMVLGKVREVDSRHFYGVIYSLMTFPYSMSEFLIERQLKKHKLGTLYPDMVEFRPIVKSNSEYQVVDCYIDTLPAVVGNYYPINSKLRIAVTTKGAADKVTSLTINGMSLGTPSVNGNRFTFNGTLSDKSPQKINMIISSYLTMLSNSTLISNETLIKNE